MVDQFDFVSQLYHSVGVRLEWVALVALVGVFLEELAIWIGQELVTLEREADRVLFQPRFLACQSLWLIGRRLDFDFA